MNNARLLLNKIMDLFHKDNLSHLEQDLLLDYTRQFYDSLLSESLHSGLNADSNDEILPPTLDNSEIEVNLSGASEMSIENEDSENPILKDVLTEEEFNEKEEKAEPNHVINEDENDLPEEIIDTPLEHKSLPEDEIKDDLDSMPAPKKAVSSISFELPHPAEEEPYFPAEGIEEDSPDVNVGHKDISILPEEEKGEDVLSDYAQIFNTFRNSSVPNEPRKGDIRQIIGINDKYLFLNELFNNQKGIYEKTLDEINQKASCAEAVEWVKNDIAVNFKWYKDDETVQNFYDTLSKHFASK